LGSQQLLLLQQWHLLIHATGTPSSTPNCESRSVSLLLIEIVINRSSRCDENDAMAAVLEGFSQRLRRIESTLEGHRNVLVVGGGIVGASIALQLSRQGCQVCLVEADGMQPIHIEMTIHIALFIIRGCTHPARPYWSAQPNRRRTVAQLANHGHG
jgi:hypothetical protein